MIESYYYMDLDYMELCLVCRVCSFRVYSSKKSG